MIGGPPAAGKTHLMQQIGAKLRRPRRRQLPIKVKTQDMDTFLAPLLVRMRSADTKASKIAIAREMVDQVHAALVAYKDAGVRVVVFAGHCVSTRTGGPAIDLFGGRNATFVTAKFYINLPRKKAETNASKRARTKPKANAEETMTAWEAFVEFSEPEYMRLGYVRMTPAAISKTITEHVFN